MSVCIQVNEGNEHMHRLPSSWCHLKNYATHTGRLVVMKGWLQVRSGNPHIAPPMLPNPFVTF